MGNVITSNLEVHLTTTRSVTRNKGGRPFQLNDKKMHIRDLQNKAQTIHEIIDWLNVEKSKRYQKKIVIVKKKKRTKTYCNVYAYDYCYLCQTYIPRVWWYKNVLKRVRSGEKIKPEYGVTVKELNANALYDWFKKYGSSFDWRPTKNLNELQESANKGKICIVVAKTKKAHGNGHITAIVPETSKHKAVRKKGKVIKPVESQAGSNNYKYVVNKKSWWKKKKYSNYQFWIHGPNK